MVTTEKAGITRRSFLFLGAQTALLCALPASLHGCSSGTGSTSGEAGASSDSSAVADDSAQLSATENADGSLTQTYFAFDTVIQITAWCDQDLMNRACERCTYFDDTLSPTISGSDVWNINTAAGAPVEVSDTTADLIAKSLEYCALSDGKLDITIGTVSLLWDFDNAVKPSDADIQAGLPTSTTASSRSMGTRSPWPTPTRIDLGATAKGYIADDLATAFHRRRCTGALINLGGNVYALGPRRTAANGTSAFRIPTTAGGPSSRRCTPRTSPW